MNKKCGACKSTGWHCIKFVEPEEEEDTLAEL
jgi:hypothetical protein